MSDTIIIDRREQRGRSSPSRQRLLRRIDQQIKQAIPDIIENNSLDQLTNKDQKIFIPVDNLAEPRFIYDDELGRRYRFYTGNDKFMPGDKIPRPFRQGGDGEGGKEGSDDPTKSQDKFGIVLNKDEFLRYFYQDLELPLMEERKSAHSLDSYQWVHSGRTNYGPPPRLNVIHSLKNSLGRRIALGELYAKRIRNLETQLEDEEDESRIATIESEIFNSQRRKRVIPFLEDVDLRFNRFKKEPIPVNNAVMMCLMDVSGSMTKENKDIAKRFYFFLYLMLTLNYDNVDIVWIRHTTDAKRVSEEEFFHGTETGGTVVSSSLELANNIRLYGDELSPGGYPTKNWNIYFAQASDGDNSYNDMDKCVSLVSELMKVTNYYAYMQIRSTGEKNLWGYYAKVKERFPQRFQMKHINAKKEIWGVFSDLFKKQAVKS